MPSKQKNQLEQQIGAKETKISQISKPKKHKKYAYKRYLLKLVRDQSKNIKIKNTALELLSDVTNDITEIIIKESISLSNWKNSKSLTISHKDVICFLTASLGKELSDPIIKNCDTHKMFFTDSNNLNQNKK